MSRRKKKKTVSTWQDNTIHAETKIIEMLEKNVWYERAQKYKCAFTCESASGVPRMCIAWQRFPTIEQGDSVSMSGYIKNNVFFVKTLFITKRGSMPKGVQREV